MREKNRKSIASCLKFPQFTTMNVIDGQAGLVLYASLFFYSLTVDNILNIISSIDKNKSNKGTYKVENDFYKIGDCHIFFTYSDGSEMELKRVYYDESYTSYLPYNITKDGVYYELHLRK